MMRRSLSLQEERQLLDCVRSRGSLEARRDHAWMRALRYSGCRVGEFSRITVGAAIMALSHRYLHLPREIRKGGKRELTVRVTDPLWQALADLVKVREEQTGRAIAEAARDEPLVLNRYCGRLSVRSYQLRMAYWAGEARLPVAVTPHWFRHTKAMAIMRRSQAQDPRAVVQVALGHADIKSSAIYTQPTREDVDAALDAADGTLPIRKRQAARLFRERFDAALVSA